MYVRVDICVCVCDEARTEGMKENVECNQR